MATYTCIACHVAFTDPDLQREHYKTDWHRYNLKRKVVGMPPVSASTFQDKVKEHRTATENEKEAEGISGFWCKLCQKRFSSHKAFENHSNSKKHRSRENTHLHNIEEGIAKDDLSREKGDVIIMEEAKREKILADAKADMEQPKIIKSNYEETLARKYKPGDNPRMQWFKKQAKALEEESDNDDDWEDMDDDECCVDSEESGNEEQIAIDEDADRESLSSEVLATMKQRHITLNECLFCLKKSRNIELNIIHMSKRHGFFIPDLNFVVNLKGLLNYLGEKIGVGNVCLWCNEKGKAFYSLSAVLKHMRDKGHCNMLVTGDAALEYADFYDFGDMDEDDAEFVEDDIEEETLGGESQELELVLPSGASIGHRALMKYYKQKFPTVDRGTTKKQRTLARLMSQYKALGWHGGSISSNVKAQKDISYLRAMKSKYHMKLSVRNNKTMMKHFRSQIFM